MTARGAPAGPGSSLQADRARGAPASRASAGTGTLLGESDVCAAAVQVQRARVRAYLLMFQARGSCRCTMIYVVMLRYYCRYGSASK